MPDIPSNTSHARSFPVIYRPFISKSLPGFVCVTSLSRNFSGHSKRQILGSSAYFPVSQPPLTPSSDASTHPKISGSPMTNSFAVVGLHAASFSSVLQSRNACFAAGKYYHRDISGFTCRIFLIGILKNILLVPLLLYVRVFQSIF